MLVHRVACISARSQENAHDSSSQKQVVSLRAGISFAVLPPKSAKWGSQRQKDHRCSHCRLLPGEMQGPALSLLRFCPEQ